MIPAPIPDVVKVCANLVFATFAESPQTSHLQQARLGVVTYVKPNDRCSPHQCPYCLLVFVAASLRHI